MRQILALVLVAFFCCGQAFPSPVFDPAEEFSRSEGIFAKALDEMTQKDSELPPVFVKEAMLIRLGVMSGFLMTVLRSYSKKDQQKVMSIATDYMQLLEAGEAKTQSSPPTHETPRLPPNAI